MSDKVKTVFAAIAFVISALSACAVIFLYNNIYAEPLIILPPHSVDVRISALEHGYTLTDEQLYILENGSYEEVIELTLELFDLWGIKSA